MNLQRLSRHRLLATLWVLLMTFVGSLAEGAWPTYQQNGQRNAFVTEDVQPEALAVAWQSDSPCPPQPAWHGPAKWDSYSKLRGLHSMRNYDPVFHVTGSDGKVYYASSVEQCIVCLEAASGKQLWAYFTNGPVRIPPTLAQGKVYFGSDDGYAYCLDAKRGELIWKFSPIDSESSEQERWIVNDGNYIPLAPIRTGVTVDQGTAYFAASLLPWHKTFLCAVDAATGKPTGEGHFVRQQEGLTLEGSLAISDGVLIAPQGRVSPMLFSRKEGKPLGSLSGGGGAFVVIAGEEVLHGPGNKKGWLTRSNTQSRDHLATHKKARGVVVIDGISYLLTQESIIALKKAGSKPVWSTPCEDPLAMIGVGDYLFTGGVDSVSAYNRQTGKLCWQTSVAGRAFGLAFIDGQLFVSTDTGTIYGFAPSSTPSTPSVAKETKKPRGKSPAKPAEEPYHVKAGPYLEFVSPTEATVRWLTSQPTATTLTYRLGDEVQTLNSKKTKTQHSVRLTNLKHNHVYHYRIQVSLDGQQQSTAEYECDTFFNYQVTPVAKAGASDASSQEAADILQTCGMGRGLCVDLDIGSGDLARRLVASSQLRVIGLTNDPQHAKRLRQQLREERLYGTRIVVLVVDTKQPLPLTAHSANLVVSEASLAGEIDLKTSVRQASRLLAPRGKAMLLSPKVNAADLHPASAIVETLACSGRASPEQWICLTKAVAPGAGEWSHAYGRSDNSAFGGEQLSEVRQRDELAVQWVGRPGPRYQTDRSGRKPPPLSTSGRLYLQGLHRIITLDNHNGTPLWSLELPHFERQNMPRDCANWCADDHFVYAAIRDRCWKINAQSGKVTKLLQVLSDGLPSGQYDWGYVASVGDQLIGSTQLRGSSFVNIWGRKGWYEDLRNEGVKKVCSDRLFALDKATGKTNWTYQNGVIVNSTLTASNNDTIWLVESRHPDVVQANTRRIDDIKMYEALYLIALDLKTGKQRWEKKLDLPEPDVTLTLAYGSGRLALVASASVAPTAKKSFHIYNFSAEDGEQVWTRIVKWGKRTNNHGTHLSRPAMVGNRLIVRPAVMDLLTGELQKPSMPVSGCGTYACTTTAMFFRVWSGQDYAMWDFEEGHYTRWPRLRPDCWLSSIPADGLLLSPEGGGGCSCGKWLETSMAFIPRARLEE